MRSKGLGEMDDQLETGNGYVIVEIVLFFRLELSNPEQHKAVAALA